METLSTSSDHPDETTKAADRHERGWPISLYLFYSHMPGSLWTSSLYKINLAKPKPEPISYSLSSDCDSETSLSPFSLFPEAGGFAAGMKCARLGSKVYFMGGCLRCADNILSVHELYPRDVYVLFLAAPTSIPTKDLALLNTGKPNPLVFVAENKLFVLGRFDKLSFIEMKFPHIRTDDGNVMRSNLKLFECFDPDVGKWVVLKDPPSDHHYTIWEGFLFLESLRLVLLNGRKKFEDRIVHLVYDLSIGEWAPLSKAVSNFGFGYFFTSPPCMPLHPSGYSLYGCDGFFNFPETLKFDIQVTKDEVSGHPLYQFISVDEEPSSVEIVNKSNEGFPIGHEQVFCHPYLYSEIQLHALGDGYFCYVFSGAKGCRNGPDPWGFLPPDQCARGVKVVVFKDVSSYDVTSNSNSSKVEVLYSKTFVMDTFPHYSEGTLVSAFVVSYDQQHKFIKEMKKRKRRNENEME